MIVKKINILYKVGWKVFVVWECQIMENVERLVVKLAKVIHFKPALL